MAASPGWAFPAPGTLTAEATMSDWVEAAVGAVAGAIATALGVSWRAGSAKERMVADTERASKDASDAKAATDALAPRVVVLEQHRAVHDVLIARMGTDLAEIRTILEDMRDRLPHK